MPIVKGKKYPYTKKGKAMAAKAAGKCPKCGKSKKHCICKKNKKKGRS
jgi:DTW domain-containing protein YfiP